MKIIDKLNLQIDMLDNIISDILFSKPKSEDVNDIIDITNSVMQENTEKSQEEIMSDKVIEYIMNIHPSKWERGESGRFDGCFNKKYDTVYLGSGKYTTYYTEDVLGIFAIVEHMSMAEDAIGFIHVLNNDTDISIFINSNKCHTKTEQIEKYAHEQKKIKKHEQFINLYNSITNGQSNKQRHGI